MGDKARDEPQRVASCEWPPPHRHTPSGGTRASRSGPHARSQHQETRDPASEAPGPQQGPRREPPDPLPARASRAPRRCPGPHGRGTQNPAACAPGAGSERRL